MREGLSQYVSRRLSHISRIVNGIVYLPVAYCYSLVLKKRPEYRDLWLIAERGDEARDNAYYLFKYLREKEKSIHACFVIQSRSPDIDKVRCLGDIVELNSLKHYALFILCTKLVSTHFYGAQPWDKGTAFVLKLLPKKSIVKLSHGVYKDRFTFSGADVVVCSSRTESELLRHNGHASRPAIKVLGLCRYDGLVDRSSRRQRKLILVMPTFRFWLEAASGLRNRDDIFRRDPYFLCWNQFLRDQKLAELCESTGCEVIFYPHIRSHKYLHLFRGYGGDITIGDSKRHDIQELFVECAMLVTDFSSVFFDVGYMKKPVVFFQFDESEYRRKQYKEGTFSYQRDGFGPVFECSEEVVAYITDRARAEFLMDQKYLTRVEGFFDYRDKDNTRRNFEAILELGKGGNTSR